MEYSAVSAKAKRVQVFQPQPALQCYAVSADLRGRIRRSGERASSMASLKDKCACCTKETRRANYKARPRRLFYIATSTMRSPRGKRGNHPRQKVLGYYAAGHNQRLRLYPQHQLSRPELWTEGHAVDNASNVYRRPLSQGQAKGCGTWGRHVSSPHLLRLQEPISVFQL